MCHVAWAIYYDGSLESRPVADRKSAGGAGRFFLWFRHTSSVLDIKYVMMNDLADYCLKLGAKARTAARALATADGDRKNRWLRLCAEALLLHADQILEANARDLDAAETAGSSSALLDRLRLTESRLQAASDSLRAVAALPDPVGRVIEGNVRPNGLQVFKVGVPLGVIFFIYESRPNVTVDAAGLCVKSGNAVILRGGKEALHSNVALFRIIQRTLLEAGLPENAVQLVDNPDHEAVGYFLRMDGVIDLAIPRGGEALIRRVAEEARMPVLKHYQGNCHVYVDRQADLDLAERIVVNAKCQRPGVCNAAESLLVHRDVAAAFLPRIGQVLAEKGVQLRGCEVTRQFLSFADPATDLDFAAEYLDLILSVKVVEDIDEAIRHIERYGSQHTEAIITNDLRAARYFTARVDSSAVFVNASTRFNDGFELGLGAEIGISTDRFHARGPCGLQELTTYKYIVYGDGQIRT
ncbi:MAG: gamma-glutamyl phosphate reductase [Gemmatales bacterium]|nr:MAG: gamma-glutamyl phosphate reductase [Gemmatales bacterium]